MRHESKRVPKRKWGMAVRRTESRTTAIRKSMYSDRERRGYSRKKGDGRINEYRYKNEKKVADSLEIVSVSCAGSNDCSRNRPHGNPFVQ